MGYGTYGESNGVGASWGWCLVGLVLIGDGLVITPMVYAQGSLSVTESAALGLLGLVTVALAFYLLLVMIKPEWF
ncbi:MAG: hypothetical protein OHK0012_21440 [Synechococcales cyanobacterium]